MLHDFAILHRRKPRVFANPGVPTWSTCLRSLAFVSATAPEITPEPGDEFFTQHRAYQFLLEIVCGLHSPITGETEVMGQFKIFAQAWTSAHPHRISLVQRVLGDAKSLRAQHLSHLGTQSYGSWLRKNLAASRIHVIGAGHLAQEILPYLEKQGAVTVHVRSPLKTQLNCDVRALDQRAFDGGALIIAAPLTAAEIRAWLGERAPTELFDLRDDSATDRINSETIPLTTIFQQIEQTKARLVPVVNQIKAEIGARAEVLAAAEKVRPQGWDDLCA